MDDKAEVELFQRVSEQGEVMFRAKVLVELMTTQSKTSYGSQSANTGEES